MPDVVEDDEARLRSIDLDHHLGVLIVTDADAGGSGRLARQLGDGAVGFWRRIQQNGLRGIELRPVARCDTR